jgi:hypothetical protein
VNITPEPARSTLSVILLHEGMVDKTGKAVTTSLTLIDLHDIARSCRTYGIHTFYIVHPSPHLRTLAHTLMNHWQEGYGSQYNPDRKEALSDVCLVENFQELFVQHERRRGCKPTFVATSAKSGEGRITFRTMHEMLATAGKSYLLMLGTGWGMSEELLARAEFFLEPIVGPTPYNHLSVRSACAIMLDRLRSPG